MSYCSRCGSKCVENASYCQKCGACIGASVNPGQVYDLDAPDIPGFGGAIWTCIKKYDTFEGRASRSEFWYWYLFTALGGLILSIFNVPTENETEFLPLSVVLWNLFTMVPGLSVSVRRLHDTEHSGWNIMGFVVFLGLTIYWGNKDPVFVFILFFFCFILGLKLLILYCCRGTSGRNQYGAEPRKKMNFC